MFCFPSGNGSIIKVKNLLLLGTYSFLLEQGVNREIDVHGNKEEITKSISCNKRWKPTKCISSTVKPQWLEHLLDHGNLFEIWVVRDTEG